MYTFILLKPAILSPSLSIHSFHSTKEVEKNCQTDWKPNWLWSRNGSTVAGTARVRAVAKRRAL
jgi:hypothetical protein